MKRKRSAPEQIILEQRTAEQLLNKGQSVADVCCALEMSALTYHRWQQLYGGAVTVRKDDAFAAG